MTASVLGWDAVSINVHTAPKDLQAALYVTGTGVIPATPAQLAEFPKALRIAQWPVITVDESAIPDYLDLENGAITTADLPVLVPFLISAFKAGHRPGQRWPAVYCGDNTSPTAVANTLDHAGLSDSHVGIILVRWGLSQAQAETLITGPPSATNPWPIVGVQFSDLGPHGEPYDQNVFAEWWVNQVSTVDPPAIKPQVPPGQWKDPKAWEWQQVQIIGRGLDNVLYTFEYHVKTGEWVRISSPVGT